MSSFNCLRMTVSGLKVSLIASWALLPIALLADSVESEQSAAASLAAEQALLDSVGGAAQISPDRATGSKSLVRVEAGKDLLPGAPLTPAAKASAFLEEHGAVFGIKSAATELRLADTVIDQIGHSRVSYQQIYKGLPVFGAVLRGHVDADGRLRAVNGKFIADIDLDVKPLIDALRAYSVAATAVSAQQPDIRKGLDLTAKPATLMVYRTNLTRGVPGENYLVYQVEVTNDTTVREFVYVDAHTGKIVDQISGIHTLKNRRVYEASFNPDTPNTPPPVWMEGDPRPAPNPAHEDEVAHTGYAYNFFFNVSNGTYRSWDGNDAQQITVNNDPTIVCPNANWNGTSTNYCSGTSADDVVVHEWAHAYTQETSGLIYQWQSGALNESYSDIFGETVDQIDNREGVEGSAATGNNGPRSQDDSVCSEFTSETPTGDQSIRWLMGEDAFAFTPLPPVGDAAIRDMWHPNCAGGAVFVGDPGHVGEGSNYSCDAGDAGGVHTNSGVPNRAYAILVDGDTLTLKDDGTPFANPVTVNGIGLTKAASIYWRANSVYNGPASNFSDNADSLEMACDDLIGVNLPKLVTGSEIPPFNQNTTGNNDKVDPRRQLSGQIITAQDCLQVAAAIAAVEMRTDVLEKCDFEPLLNPAPAPRCGAEGVQTYFTQNWEAGMADWLTGEMAVTKTAPPGLDTRQWFVRGNLPPNLNGSAHPGQAIYQENRRDLGNCSTDDESGKLWLESPVIVVDADEPSHLLFDHYVNTEGGFDGGNVLISINGGGFVDALGNQNVIPSEAFEYNPYNGTLNLAVDQNTNPKAGQEAFHGTNPGTVFGSWGESQIDLAAAGVMLGDTVQFRWELGQDGCNGSDGWYLDEVELFTCGTAPPSDVVCGGKAATIVGTAGNDVINGTPGADVIHGLGGTDAINGLGGADTICGGNGNDTIRGGEGDDFLEGGNVQDGADGNDALHGESGNDTLFGGPKVDSLFGGTGNDALNGGGGSDTCNGGGGGGDTATSCEQTSNIP